MEALLKQLGGFISAIFQQGDTRTKTLKNKARQEGFESAVDERFDQRARELAEQNAELRERLGTVEGVLAAHGMLEGKHLKIQSGATERRSR